MPDGTTSIFVVPPVHSTARVLAVCTFAVLACLGSATRALGAADIEVLSETGTSLSMRFTAATGAQQTINFTRSSTEDVWKGPSQVGGPTPGITFGNTSPQFALPSTLRALGITPEQAVRTFDSSIANRTFDDLTIYQLCEQGEMAVALWQQGRITEIWYVGLLVQEVLALIDEQVCDRLISLCCRTIPINGGFECPTTAPNPRVSSCVAAANPQNPCPNWQQACNCLHDACTFCGLFSDCCDLVEGLQDVSAAACEAWQTSTMTNCNPPPAPDENDAVNLLVEVRERLQARIDAEV